jgi:predicted dithiol-disulfide oxidoreductase (DUF899 family)
MQNKIVSRDEWVAARKAHLKNEKALTCMRDLVSARADGVVAVGRVKPFIQRVGTGFSPR